METKVEEISDDVHRLSTYIPEQDLTYNQPPPRDREAVVRRAKAALSRAEGAAGVVSETVSASTASSTPSSDGKDAAASPRRFPHFDVDGDAR
jgi:hypothetical protein